MKTASTFNRAAFGTMAEIDRCDLVCEEIIDILTDNIKNQPRSLQQRIGPSEIGNPCTRALLHALAGTQLETDEPPAWRPWVGTQMHAGIEHAIKTSDINHAFKGGPRFLVEQRVNVGQIGNTDITGSCDLYDRITGIVIDHKTGSKTRMRKYRQQGPPDIYRTQAHLYGRGWARRGETPTQVAIIWYPRDGDLTESFMWGEPYDEQIAIDALDRATKLQNLTHAIGLDAALALYSDCADEFCRACSNRKPHGAATPAATSTAELIAASA